MSMKSKYDTNTSLTLKTGIMFVEGRTILLGKIRRSKTTLLGFVILLTLVGPPNNWVC